MIESVLSRCLPSYLPVYLPVYLPTSYLPVPTYLRACLLSLAAMSAGIWYVLAAGAAGATLLDPGPPAHTHCEETAGGGRGGGREGGTILTDTTRPAVCGARASLCETRWSRRTQTCNYLHPTLTWQLQNQFHMNEMPRVT